MFDTTYNFEEMQFSINGLIVELWGKAELDNDPGYGFVVAAISIEQPDNRVKVYSAQSIGEDRVMFYLLAEQLRENERIQEWFAEELREYLEAA